MFCLKHLKKLMEMVPNCNIVAQETFPPSGKALHLQFQRKRQTSHLKNKIIMAMFLFNESIIYIRNLLFQANCITSNIIGRFCNV